MGQEAIHKKSMANKSQQRAAVLTNLALCVAVAIFIIWFADWSWSSCKSSTSTAASTLPRALATRKEIMNSSNDVGVLQLTTQSSWEMQATANLTSYRSTLLSQVRPHYGKQNWWTVFLPVISCPPDRPLTRYGGTGDGSKLLCSVSSTSVLQEKGCIIYSLGSAGEENVVCSSIPALNFVSCTSKAARMSYERFNQLPVWMICTT